MHIGKFGAIELTPEQRDQILPLMKQLKENGMIVGQLHYDKEGENLSMYLKVATPEEAPAILSAWGGGKDLTQLPPYCSAVEKLTIWHGDEKDGSSK